MPITLQQAKVGMADKVNQSVIDKFQRESFILDKLTFDNAVAPGTGGSTMTYGYVQLKTPSTAEGRAINSEYTPGEAIKEKKTTEVKILGGSFQIDRVLESTAAASEIAFQTSEKIKATRNEFHNLFINGDAHTHPTQFDGLDKLITGSDTEFKPASPIDLTNVTKIEQNADQLVMALEEMVGSMAEKPDVLLMNTRMATILNTVARKLGYKTESEDAFGRKVDAWNGIEIRDMGKYYDKSKGKSVDVIETGAGTGETTIYAVKFGLDGLHGVSPTGNKVIQAYMPNMKEPGAVKKGEVELLAGICLKNSKMAGALRKIKVAEVEAA